MIAHLTDRGVIAVEGPEAVSFLNGLVSQDVTKVTPEQPLYGCLLTPQGKYFSDFFMILEGERILLDIALSRLQPTLNRLKMFLLRAKATLMDASDGYRVYAHWADDAAPVAALTYPDPRLAAMGRRSLTRDVMETTASLSDYHAHRIQNGVPDVGDFELERTALLEANLDILNGVSFDKGCYMGQELTARTHYRGLVKKRLLPFAFDGDAPAFDSELRTEIDGQSLVIGHTRSTAGSYGLALVKLEYASVAASNGITINGVSARLSKPDKSSPLE